MIKIRTVWACWSQVWRVNDPQRCKLHMWVTLHGSLLNNEELFHRHLHQDGICKACPSHKESSLHMLRDCVRARGIWFKLGVPLWDREFWECDVEEWLWSNIKLTRRNEVVRWNELFCVACWLIWRRRNEFVHHGGCPSIWDAEAEIRGIVRCMDRAKSLLVDPVSLRSRGVGVSMVGDDGVMVFVDGAFWPGANVVGCGGVIKDSKGQVLEIFMSVVHGSSSIEAELWGCVWGLRRAWDAGFRRVLLFCDASQVVEGVSNSGLELHINDGLFRVVRDMLSKDWQVELRWIRRDDNEIADFLARRSFSQGLGFHLMLQEQAVQFLQEAAIS